MIGLKKLANECLFAFFLLSVNDDGVGATLLASQRNQVIVFSPNRFQVRTALISGCRTAGFVVCVMLFEGGLTASSFCTCNGIVAD